VDTSGRFLPSLFLAVMLESSISSVFDEKLSIGAHFTSWNFLTASAATVEQINL
jgi:hypothetical protein